MDIKEREHGIRVFTLSRFNLVKGGRPVRFSRKPQQRPITLLKALIALGGREVKEEELTNILWPETDGDSAHGAFAVNLHRLRRLVGNEKAVNFRDGKVTLNSRYCYVDVWLFERLLGKADTALKGGGKNEAMQLIEKAASIYSNPFLQDEHAAPWADKLCKRLQSKFIRYVGKLGMLYEEKDEFEKAIDTFKKAIEIDPLSEGLYQHLMQCYQKLGRRAEALVVYNNLKEILFTALGVEPSSQTAAICKILINK